MLPTTGGREVALPAPYGTLVSHPEEVETPAPELISERYTADHLNESVAGLSQAVDRRSAANLWGPWLVIVVSLIWAAGMVLGFQTALSIQLVLAFLLAIGGLFSPGLGLIAVGMLSALDAMATEYVLLGGLLRFNTVNYWFILVLVFYLPFVLRLRDFPARALQLFWLLITLEIVFSLDINEGLQDALNVAATFGMVVYFARSLRDEVSLYWLGVVTGVLAGVGGLIYFLQFDALPYANPNNWVYFNITALFSICISLPYAVALRKSRLILILLVVMNVVWVFLSASRGGMLLASICVLYLFLNTRSLTWSTVMIAIGLAAGLWLSSQFVERQIYSVSRIELLLDPSAEASRRTSKRSNLAEAGLEIFMDNPMGVGTGSFRRISDSTGLVGKDRPSHSGWIKTLAENGIPGILLLTVYVLSYALSGLQKHAQGKFMFGLFVTLAIAAAFVSKEFQGKSHWFLAAAGIVLLSPKEMLAYLNQKLKPNDIDYRRRLREVRFGRRGR